MTGAAPGRLRWAAALLAVLAVLAVACAGAGSPGAGDPTPPAAATAGTATAGSTPGAGATGAAPTVGAPSPTVHTTTVPDLHPSVDGYPEATVTLRAAAGGRAHRLAVKVADTPERRRHGLMEVPDLPAGTGMLFTFPDDRTGGFWMRDTLVPLSIAYVDASGTVVDVLDMQPCPTPPPTGSCPVYPPDGAYRTALEVPRGFLARIGVGPGATMTVDR